MLKIASGRWSVEREIGAQLLVTFTKCVCSWEHMGVRVCAHDSCTCMGESESCRAEEGHKEDEGDGF